MGRRKGKPQANLGRPEDRDDFLAEAGGGGGWQAADVFAQAADSEPSDDEEEQPRRRAKRRCREPLRQAEPNHRSAKYEHVVVDASAAEDQAWRFAELRVKGWSEAAPASTSTLPQQHILEDSQLLLRYEQVDWEARCQASRCHIDVVYQPPGSGGQWQGSLSAPDESEAGALLGLLARGRVSCALSAQPPADGDGCSLCFSLTTTAFEDAAEDPEGGRVCGDLQILLHWLRPELDPELELELGAPLLLGGSAAATELLSSPLCSPRANAPSSPRDSLAQQPGSALAAAPGGGFDAAELYSAVKPSGTEPELPAGATAGFLLPTLRRYQARAAQWMVDRERGTARLRRPLAAAPGGDAMKQEDEEGGTHDQPLHPLWRRVPCDGRGGASSCFYFNPFDGSISLQRFPAPQEPRGGILADEMGLGKTVELLACVAAHRYTGPPPVFESGKGAAARRGGKRRAAVVACLCGATEEEGYDGLWLQCDECDVWMHAACCGLRRAPRGEWICGGCRRSAAAETVMQDCGATLVVCPTPILHQWRDEILRHIQPGAVKLLLYEGQPQPGAGASARPVTAADMAAADIVLTTYDVLRKDMYRCPDVGEGIGRTLRFRKKYEVVPTPLTRLRWWRVVLDEAQMVESSTAKAAEMALKLHAVHRWCVTGTPLSRGLEDLFGLLAFLQAAPYDCHDWWRAVMQEPYEEGSRAGRARLLALLRPSLGGLLWRSSKADVATELGLPPQHHHLKLLQLSAIERHFYKRQHEDCVTKARAALPAGLLSAAMAAAAAADGVTEVPAAEAGPGLPRGPRSPAGFADRALSRREEASLLHPLLRLRQACCHPQVGGSGIRAAAGGGMRAPMTMGEVLEVMLTKARLEAEDAQRLLLASLNGLAGLLLLQGQAAEAVRAYREALATVEQNKALIRADKLQQLHTLSNLASLLGSLGGGAEGVAPTLRDAELDREAQAIREEYLAESAARLAAHLGEFRDSEQAAARCLAPLTAALQASKLGGGGAGSSAAAGQRTQQEAEELLQGWYMRAVALIAAHGHGAHSQRAVADRIKEQVKEDETYLRPMSKNATTIAGRFRDLFGLELAAKQELRELDTARTEALEELQRLQDACGSPSPSLIELAASCGRCRQETAVAGRVCRHCRLEERFLGWEGRAFDLYSKAREGAGRVTADEAIRQAHASKLNRVGQGGLGEEAGAEAPDEAGAHLMLGAGRRGDAVAKTEIVRKPGAAEKVLRLLLHQLRLLKVPPAAAAEKDLVAAAGKAHLDLLEHHRRLYLRARALSLAQRQRLYALDELEQCTMRLKLLGDDELRLREGEEIYRVYAHEVPIRSTELSNDKASAELELRAKLGTLRYLLGVKAREAARSQAAAAAEAAAATAAGSAQGAADGTLEPSGGTEEPAAAASRAAVTAQAAAAAGEPAGGQPRGCGGPAAEEDGEDACPICHDRLGPELVMLPCAHRLCCKCSLALQERQKKAFQPQARRRIECPVCRRAAPLAELVYVDARLASPGGRSGEGGPAPGAAAEEEQEAAIAVRGSYGSKLEAVVARLLRLLRADDEARVLVFSTWADVLDLVSHALRENGLPHLYPKGGTKKFEAAVAEFRSGPAVDAVAGPSKQAAGRSAALGGKQGSQPARILLLLVKQGANGLNLTEAQHVLLVDPLLDPAVEAQAVGRVDRIGQRHATHVHRFVVQRTIEENVHRLCQQRAAAMDLSAASVKRSAGSGTEHGALTLHDVAQLLRQPEDEAEPEPEPELGGGAEAAGPSSPGRQLDGGGEAAGPSSPGRQVPSQQQQQQQQQQQEAEGPRQRAAAAAQARAAAAAAAAVGAA